jgi:uncharacterized DUF497 family protein
VSRPRVPRLNAGLVARRDLVNVGMHGVDFDRSADRDDVHRVERREQLVRPDVAASRRQPRLFAVGTVALIALIELAWAAALVYALWRLVT